MEREEGSEGGVSKAPSRKTQPQGPNTAGGGGVLPLAAGPGSWLRAAGVRGARRGVWDGSGCVG